MAGAFCQEVGVEEDVGEGGGDSGVIGYEAAEVAGHAEEVSELLDGGGAVEV